MCVGKDLSYLPVIIISKVFAYITRSAIVQFMIALSVSFGWKMRQSYVEHAFVTVPLSEKVCLKRPFVFKY